MDNNTIIPKEKLFTEEGDLAYKAMIHTKITNLKKEIDELKNIIHQVFSNGQLTYHHTTTYPTEEYINIWLNKHGYIVEIKKTPDIGCTLNIIIKNKLYYS
jgi:hypothetical protein